MRRPFSKSDCMSRGGPCALGWEHQGQERIARLSISERPLLPDSREAGLRPPRSLIHQLAPGKGINVHQKSSAVGKQRQQNRLDDRLAGPGGKRTVIQIVDTG